MTAEKEMQQDPVTSHIVSSQKQRDMNAHVVTCLLTWAELRSLLMCVPGPCLDMVLSAMGCVFLKQPRKMRQPPPPHTSTDHTSVDSLSSRDNPNYLSHGSLPQVVLGCVKLTIKLTFTADKGTL